MIRGRPHAPLFVPGLFTFALLAISSCLGRTGQLALPQRLPFPAAEQEAYLDGLIRNAPSEWKHGKNWAFIDPYVLGRSVSQPSAQIVCPDLGHADAFNDSSANLPSWVYSASEACDELSTAHGSALLLLEDPKDNDAGYFLFLICNVKRSRSHCEVAPSAEGYGMKLEESNKGENREFDVIAETTDDKTGRFSVAEVWHMRSQQPEPTEKQ